VALTIDELAGAAGTTTRSIRSFQTMGLLEGPSLKGRTGQYATHHLDRLRAILRLQGQGYSLQSLALLFGAHERGDSLGDVLGLDDRTTRRSEEAESDAAELYGFSDLQAVGTPPWSTGRRRPLLAVVPTTMWDQTEAS
jgi:DNA-binding transcriptional MerR regulator